MLTIKSINIIILSLIFSVYLGGCAATQPATVPAEAEEAAVEVQPQLSEPAPEPAPAIQEEESIETSPQDSSLDSVLEYWQSSNSMQEVVDPADIEFIQHRLIVYENKFEQWLEVSEIALKGELAAEISDLETECMQKLETILSGYNNLMAGMQQSTNISFNDPAAFNPKEMQQLDIAFLESRCNELLAMDNLDQYVTIPEAEPEPSFAAAQLAIAADMEQGNYQDVLLAYAKLAQDFPGQNPSITTQLNYGRALQFTGQLEAAARHFKSMLASSDLVVEPLSLQREIADLHLASDNTAAAESYYKSMLLTHQSLDAEKTWAQAQLAFLASADPDSEDMKDYMNLLREFQTKDYKMHGPRLNELVNTFAAEHAGSPAAVSALRLKTFAAEQLKIWFGRQLVRIDSLVSEKKFTEATDILKSISHYNLPAELQAVVQRTSYEMALDEIQEEETQRRLKEMELSDQWDTAVSLLDSEQYDSAITAFDSLLATEYEEKAKMKIIEAANLAAGQMRKEAASLFIKAGKTPDLEQKKNLLLESHTLLNEILIRYPQTELRDKVQQNITILEEQIGRLDPGLLDEMQQKNPAEFTADPYGTRTRQFQ